VIPQLLALINGKGGTLKTTISANTGGILAAAGYRVLLVDLDPQGNLRRDLGVYGAEVDDQGAALAAALTGRAQLTPARNVRERLDLAVGGDVLDDVDEADLDEALAPIADDYDLIIADCPPGNQGGLQLAALQAARFVLIPTRPDEASLDGLRRIAKLFAAVRADGNPDLELLGVVLADIGSQSRAIMREARADVERMFGRDDAMCVTTIRHAEAPSRDARKLGKLVHELDRELYASLSTLPDMGPRRFATSAPGLAGDHQRLAAEIAERISARVEAAEAEVAGVEA